MSVANSEVEGSPGSEGSPDAYTRAGLNSPAAPVEVYVHAIARASIIVNTEDDIRINSAKISGARVAGS